MKSVLIALAVAAHAADLTTLPGDTYQYVAVAKLTA